MAESSRTGSRIRERRLSLGMRQAALAQTVGISASYLNLIEHNRRRIGGALLNRLADALQVAPELLLQGAEAALVERLQEAAAAAQDARPERDRVDDFTGRFPGWAALVAEQSGRIAGLEHALARLSDRMTHDPHLATALHDMLSTITSIRSTAAILADTQDITPEWRARFDRNIHEDSRRLSEGSQSLVAYLDTAGDGTADPALSPLDEVARMFDRLRHHVPVFESGGTVDDVLDGMDPPLGPGAASIARGRLEEIRADARALPLPLVQAALDRLGFDPVRLAEALDTGVARLLRRLAHLPPDMLPQPVGLVICDGAGALLHRRELPDFPLPRYDAACALWPLFDALSRPGVPLVHRLHLSGREGVQFDSYAVAEPAGPVGFDAPARIEAVMLFTPHGAVDGPARPVRRVGPTCRICVEHACPARRVPTLVGEAASA
ncbi:helix-turn-helix transcriptional regulator [Pseudaestuariivita atlantica]|uniref:helix-turn-helix transcriptional regulator n=1 Tax=Pseudaestuariivita atlantica TaxID=1317121 RepID=UPI000ACDC81A|nr:helix-turn-helix transcriptional regulator [Pseudaestuariivita atlantica]